MTHVMGAKLNNGSFFLAQNKEEESAQITGILLWHLSLGMKQGIRFQKNIGLKC